MRLKDYSSEKTRYDYSDYPIYIRHALLSTYPNYTAPSHFHDDIELIAILSGEMQYNINGDIITLKSNEGIIVNARQIHFGFSNTKIECEFICILLHPMLLCTTPAYERDFVMPVINNIGSAYIKLNIDILWQRDIYKQIKLMYNVKNEKTAPMKVQAAFSAIWSLMYENTLIIDRKEKRQNCDLTVIKNMIGFIQQNYAEKIYLADIAASGAVGQSKCCKLFSKYLGQTPNMYLNQYRLDKSTKLLQNTDMSIIEIAINVGFSGASYYAESFRKWIGMSPTEYKNKFT